MKKKTTLIITMVFCAVTLFAQAPEKLNYQAVVRNAGNALVTNTQVSVRMSILQGSTSGSAVYVETQTATTNANGLMTVEIGGGNAQQGVFADINWANGPYFLKTETDPSGGSNYSVTSTQQLLSVPYALYAKEAGNSFSGDYNDLANTPVIPTVPTNVSAFTNDAGYITTQDVPTIPTVPSNVSAFANDAGYLTDYTETDPQYNAWNKDYNDLINTPQIPTVPTNVSAFNNDVPYLTAEQQILSISNDTIFLTGGSFVKLPEGFSGSWNDLTDKPEIPEIPTVPDSVSAFTNDAGYITMADLEGLLDELNALNDRIDSLENLVNNQTPAVQDTVDGQPCPGVQTVTDYDGNTYNTVQIGKQCWMKENLRTTHYADGSDVPSIQIPNNNGGFMPQYGYLYDWSSVMHGAASSITAPSGVQGICPNGWHIPSETEWTLLTDYMGSQNAYVCGGNSNNVAKALASTTGWTSEQNSDGSCAVGSSPWTNNATGFNALPVGYYQCYSDGDEQECYGEEPFGSVSLFHTSTNMILKVIYTTNANVLGYAYPNIYASVRCVRGDASDTSNVFTPTLPEVQTDTVTYITSTSASVGCRIISSGGSSIIHSGLVWSESPNPTFEESDWEHKLSNSGNAAHYTDSITGLNYQTTYYVRAYATNAMGIAYGDEVSFTTAVYEYACPDMPKVTDVDGNVYNTIQIGNQCWMKENLRTRHYANGSLIDTMPTSSYTDMGDRYFGDMARATKKINDVNSTFLLQGVCPDGWHLPTIAEWNTFMENNTFGTGYNSSFGSACSYWTGVGNYSFNICNGTTQGSISYSYSNSENMKPVRCVRGEGVTLPTIRLDSVTNILMNTANYNAEVLSGNGFDVIDRGICWATSPKPTISNYYTSRQAGLNNVSAFSGTIGYDWPFLSPGTIYYVRAYATNYLGTSYSNEIVFTTLTEIPDTSTATLRLPTVRTGYPNSNITVYGITSTSAGSGCWVTDNGGAEITEQGICWSTSPHPTIDDNYVSGSNSITNLESCTTYYVRAYAINVKGIAYGNEVTFTTMCSNPMTSDGQPCADAPTLTDMDNNTYNTVKIGNQCWMKENLRTTRFANGENISGYSAFDLGSVATVGYRYPNIVQDESITTAGPTGMQGICPDGWHLPSYAEWKQLIDYVGGQNSYICGNLTQYQYTSEYYPSENYDYYYGMARALGAKTGWAQSDYDNDCSPSHDLVANNATGFSAIPTTNFTSGSGNVTTFCGIGGSISVQSGGAVVLYPYNLIGAVRCLKGEGASLPTVLTSAVSEIADSTAVAGGEVTNGGSESVTERGVCWSRWNVPSTDDAHLSSGDGVGSFTVNLSGLTSGTNYYVRAYAISAAGTAYGETVTFTTAGQQTSVGQDGQACPDAATVSDYDGNTYNTVQIGNQCWMKENLRTTHYADGLEVPLNAASWSGETVDNASRFAPNGEESSVSTYGYLYNWSAVMKGANSATGNPSGVQGICPAGWHVPSDAEWTQLTDYLLSQNMYACGDSSVVKALADTMGWQTSEAGCSPGNNLSGNNTTGFAMRPAGEWRVNYAYFGKYAEFWTATGNEEYDETAFAREFTYEKSSFYATPHFYKNDGYSVRCVKGQGANIPTVETGIVGLVKDTSAMCGGHVISDGGSPITESGICVSAAHIPTISDYHESMGAYNGSFGALAQNLTPGTTYYVRAYAMNAIGIAYGDTVSFTTITDSTVTYAPCQSTPTVVDYDGNFYNTVQIGDQCWMRENLRSARYADGSFMNNYAYPNGDESLVEQYGYLYGWSTVMHSAESSDAYPSGVQGVCPDGWHVPSLTEWQMLFDYVSSQSGNICGDDPDNIAKALASQTGWFNDFTECSVGNNQSQNNTTGFNALPANSLASAANFWTTSKNTLGSYPMYILMRYDNANVSNYYDSYGGNYMSVRCVRTESVSAPAVSTVSVTTDVDSMTVTVTGEVTSDGHAMVYRGICWSTAQYPTLSPGLSSPYIHGVSQPAGTGVGTFSVNLPGLQSGHTYYVRAYAYNGVDTVYGAQLTVTPTFHSLGAACPESNRVIDRSGNVYSTVQIGNQCWMKENLRTKRYANGNSVSTYYYPNSEQSNQVEYGLLYPWAAVMNGASSSSANPSGVQGICPTGWHVPSQSEWQQLSDYVSASGSTLDQLGFAIVNAGFYGYGGYDYYGFEEAGYDYCWSSTQYAESSWPYTSNNAFYSRSGQSWGGYYANKSAGFSVRCVLNQTDMSPTVTTGAATGIDDSTATLHGSFANPYNVAVTDFGFEWKRSEYYSSEYVAVSMTENPMSYQLSNLIPNKTYVYRAYVTTMLGTVYGNEVTFKTSGDGQPCPNAPTLTDYDGNTYNTAKMGTQCWMASNLRTTHYADGTAIAIGSNLSSDHAYYYNGSYGLWYNWLAVMGGSSSSNSNPSGVQGVCPAGWHVPSSAEWGQLLNYVRSNELYLCDNNTTNIAKSLCTSSGWSTSSNTCAVGTNQANTNNATGFSILPGGKYWGNYGVESYYVGKEAWFWTATGYDNDNARQIYISYDSPMVYSSYTNKNSGHSVRCLKD